MYPSVCCTASYVVDNDALNLPPFIHIPTLLVAFSLQHDLYL